MKKKILLAVITLFTTSALAACSNDEGSDNNADDGKLSIVTTFYPIYDFTQNVVGDEGDVELLIPAGTEPHDFEPSAQQIAKTQDADAFVYHDDNMETWVTDTIEGWEDGNPEIIKGTEDIELMTTAEDSHEKEEGHDQTHEYDPHTWVDPKLAIKEVEAINEQLSQAYPDKKETFKENTENYVKELEELDQEYEDSLANAQQKSFVTQHAAFGYLADAYDLNQVSISGLSPDEEPSPERLAELKDYVEDNDIQYIYFEENASDKIAKTLSDEVGVKLEVLNPLESLTDEQMDNGEDYISVMKDNLQALEKTTDSKGKEIQSEESGE